jgi:hypothetical protein
MEMRTKQTENPRSTQLRSKKQRNELARRNLTSARQIWGDLNPRFLQSLEAYSTEFRFSIIAGDLLYLDNGWYVTYTGLIRLAARRRCRGIQVQPTPEFSDAQSGRYAFQATVYKSRTCRGFAGYGDADPSNVSPLVHGAELRVAETRAVNRALRKAYGIGICSVEEIGSFAGQPASRPESKKLPQPANGNGNGSGNHGPKVRDRLCQLIRQHQLDANLVKSYAIDFCGAKTLRDATRDQVEAFVAHLSDWAEKDRNALLCQLNSYLGQKDGAA